MSIYTLISTQVPTVAYSAIRQQAVDTSNEEFLDRLKERHARIRTGSDALEAAFRKFLADTTSKEAQTIRGMLSPFLHTPISSDDADVRTMLTEGLQRFTAQLLDGGQAGVKFATEGKIAFPPLKKSRERKLLANGRAYLLELGFDTTKDRADLLECIYVLQGSKNLDVLEHLLSENLVIDAGADGGPPITRSVSRLHNLVFTKGSFAVAAQGRNLVEVSVAFSRPDLKYASFCDALLEGLEKLNELFAHDHISLWQQKLELGPGREFVLRIVGNNLERAIESILWIESYKNQAFLKQAIVGQGSLIVKELFI